MQTHYVRLIKDKHKATKGVTRTNSRYLAMLKREKMLNIVHGINWFDYICFALFVVTTIVLCFVIRPFTITFILSITTFLLYSCSNLLISRGKLLGPIIGTINNLVYITLCIIQSVYGEIFINVVLYLPLSIACIVTWYKNRSGETEQLEIKSFTPKAWVLSTTLPLIASAIGYVILGVVLHQKLALINAFSIAIGATGDIIRNLRYKQFSWFYIVSNTLSIALWLGLSVTDISMLPVAFSSVFGLVNSIRGVVYWQNMWHKLETLQGKILAKRKLNIRKIIKLKHRFQKMKWKVGT